MFNIFNFGSKSSTQQLQLEVKVLVTLTTPYPFGEGIVGHVVNGAGGHLQEVCQLSGCCPGLEASSKLDFLKFQASKV